MRSTAKGVWRTKIQETAKAVWVPNRNGVLLNVAAAYAERFRAKRIVVGFNREEATTFPDNSRAFLDQTTRAFAYSTRNGVEAYCYTTAMDKTEIVGALKALARPFPHAHQMPMPLQLLALKLEIEMPFF